MLEGLKSALEARESSRGCRSFEGQVVALGGGKLLLPRNRRTGSAKNWTTRAEHEMARGNWRSPLAGGADKWLPQ